MARRTPHAAPEPAPTLDAGEVRRRYSQLCRRLRLSFPYEGPEYRQVARRIADLRERPDDPAQRLANLLDLADELGPLPAVNPSLLEKWRAGLG